MREELRISSSLGTILVRQCIAAGPAPGTNAPTPQTTETINSKVPHLLIRLAVVVVVVVVLGVGGGGGGGKKKQKKQKKKKKLNKKKIN